MASKRDTAAQKLGFANQAERERIQRLYKRHNVEWKPGQRKPSAGNIKRVESGRKPRDYSKEFKQRSAKAQKLGYSSYSQKRRAVTAAHNKKFHPAMIHMAENPQQYGFNPRTRMAKYDPAFAARNGIPIEEYTLAYVNAFIMGPDRYNLNRHKSTPALRKWFVDYVGMKEAEYDERYSM